MRKKLTHEEFVDQVNNKYEGNIEIIGKYELYNKEIECRCKIDNFHWFTTPAKLLYKGLGCKICKRKAITLQLKEQTNEKIHLVNPNITIVGDYIDAKTKTRCVCKLCNNEFYNTPNNLLTNYTCGVCGSDYKGIKQIMVDKRRENFIKRLKDSNENIKLIGTFKGTNIKTKVKCLIDNYEWDAIPANLLNGHAGCPICNSISKGEARIRNYLSKNNTFFEFQVKFSDLKGKRGYALSYDFYLPNYNLLIEYQGQQHERPIDWFGGEEHFKTQLENDNIKRNYAEEHNIELMEIWYWDFDNIEQILSNKLNINSNKKSA